MADQDLTGRRTKLQGHFNVTVSDVHSLTSIKTHVSGTRNITFMEELVAMFKFLSSHPLCSEYGTTHRFVCAIAISGQSNLTFNHVNFL